MNAASVRRAAPGDLEVLVALCADHAAFERAPFEPGGKVAALGAALFGVRPKLRAWVGCVDTQVVAYASATEEFSTWDAAAFLHMDCLFVRPEHRNRGLGAALLRAVLDYARAEGLREVHGQTPAWNSDAVRFYQRHGATHQSKLRFRLP